MTSVVGPDRAFPADSSALGQADATPAAVRSPLQSNGTVVSRVSSNVYDRSAAAVGGA
jgi:hypothetical protein